MRKIRKEIERLGKGQILTDDEFVVYNNRIPFERGLFPRNACESGGMADAPDLGSGAFGRGGSSPFSRTNLLYKFSAFAHVFKSRKNHRSNMFTVIFLFSLLI